MWKDRRPTEMPKRTDTEDIIDKRDKSIRNLTEELVTGIVELKALYAGSNSDDAK